jgi:aminopeptidase
MRPVQGRFAPEDVERYARAIVFDALRMKPGDTLFVDCEAVHRELIAALAAVCYRDGIDIDVKYEEPLVLRARLLYAPDEMLGRATAWDRKRMRATIGPNSGYLWILSQSDPDALADAPPDRLAIDRRTRSRQYRWLVRAAEDLHQKWCIVDFPTDGWAVQAYPEVGLDEAHRRLFADLLSFMRAGPDDPAGAWAKHAERLVELAAMLDERHLRTIRYHGSGTDLEVALIPGAIWCAGARVSPSGEVVSVNVPTEEVFTSPDRRSASGTFACSKPLSIFGRVIEGINGEFKGGRLTRIGSDREDDTAFLRELCAARGGDRIGEVALVDARSRIGRAGRVYWSSLLDENAASHFAFGRGFATTVLPDGDAAARRLVNASDVHLDVMIGTPDQEVTGTDARGRVVPVIRDGSFCLS